MSNPQDFRTRYLRWLIVLTLNQARPTGAPDRLVLQVAQAEYANCTLLELRRAEIANWVVLYKSLGGGLHERDVPEIAAVRAAH